MATESAWPQGMATAMRGCVYKTLKVLLRGYEKRLDGNAYEALIHNGYKEG
jgi:hypothetical protein